MGRQARVEYAGATYHLMCRGNRQEVIFQNDGDRRVFLETLAEVCERTGWQVCAYVLMSNHYHLIVHTPEANLVSGMKWFQGTYTKRYNMRNQVWGHLFQGRYKSMVIDSEEPEYFRAACDYVHLNPVRAYLVGGKGQGSLSEYPWSSCVHLSGPSREDPPWMSVHRIVEAQTGREDNCSSRRMYLQYLEGRVAEERKSAKNQVEPEEYKGLRRGWCFGCNEFKDELKDGLMKPLSQVSRDSIVGEPRRMHDEYEAACLLKHAVGFVGLSLDEKEQLRKNDLRKELVSWFLSKKTSVTQEWMAQQLGMGSRANVSRAIQRIERTKDVEIEKKKIGLDKMYRCIH